MEHLPHGLSVSTERTHFGPPLGPMGPRRAFPIRPLRLVTDALGGPQALALADFWCFFAWGPPTDTKRCLTRVIHKYPAFSLLKWENSGPEEL